MEISPDMLDVGDVYPIVSFFALHHERTAEELAAVAACCGRCFMTFPVPAADPDPVWKVPEVRAYVQGLERTVPYLPMFFTPDSDHSMFSIWFGSLAEPEAFVGDALQLDHPSVLGSVAHALQTAALAADLLNIDQHVAWRNVFGNTPVEWQDYVVALVASSPDDPD
jgi:hypothetical protein